MQYINITIVYKVDESQWDLVVEHNVTSASLVIRVSGAGPHLVRCLTSQQDMNRYNVAVVGDSNSQQYLHAWLHSWQGTAADLLVDPPPVFNYLIYGGRYRVEFREVCEDMEKQECSPAPVYSDYVNIQSRVQSWCGEEGWEGNSSLIEISVPTVMGSTGIFQFSYSPCSQVDLTKVVFPFHQTNIGHRFSWVIG